MAGGPRAKVVATTFGSIKPLGFAGPWMTLLMSSVMGCVRHPVGGSELSGARNPVARRFILSLKAAHGLT